MKISYSLLIPQQHLNLFSNSLLRYDDGNNLLIKRSQIQYIENLLRIQSLLTMKIQRYHDLYIMRTNVLKTYHIQML